MRALIIVLLLMSAIHATSEEWIEDQWVVDNVTEDTVYVSVNGQVTHEDRLRIRMIQWITFAVGTF